MINIPDINGKSFGVYGLGATGLASAKALVASGAEVYSWDEQTKAREATKNTQYRAEDPDQWPWDKLSGLVLSPGVPFTHPEPHKIVKRAKESSVEIISDLELFAWATNALPEASKPKIITVTGSNGKSTTTSLIAHILRETGHRVFEGGNIGQAVLSLPPIEENTAYVLELSSYQLDLIKTLHADISVFLNISPDHLDRHGGMDGYVSAKRRIFRNQGQADIAVIGVDDAISQSVCTDLTAQRRVKVIPVSAQGTLGHGVFALGDTLFYNFDTKTTKAGVLKDVPALKGRHNQQNAAAALAVTTHLGVSPPVAVLAMQRFKGLPHRMEKTAQIGKVLFINDSKATNVDAVAQALDAFEDIFWLAGGRAKEGGIIGLGKNLKHVRQAYFFGEAGPQFSEELGDQVASKICARMQEAIQAAYEDAINSDAKNPVVLLSPAATSFDQFKDFEERGDVFRHSVESLSSKGGQAA